MFDEIGGEMQGQRLANKRLDVAVPKITLQ
jgi:hypothetical protein